MKRILAILTIFAFGLAAAAPPAHAQTTCTTIGSSTFCNGSDGSSTTCTTMGSSTFCTSAPPITIPRLPPADEPRPVLTGEPPRSCPVAERNDKGYPTRLDCGYPNPKPARMYCLRYSDDPDRMLCYPVLSGGNFHN
jgi:hypothetical protein